MSYMLETNIYFIKLNQTVSDVLLPPPKEKKTWNEFTKSRMKWGLTASTVLKTKITSVVVESMIFNLIWFEPKCF